jgi:hypothetical protein
VTPERKAEITRWMRKYGQGNNWVGTVGCGATMIHELLAELAKMDPTHLPPNTTVESSAPRLLGDSHSRKQCPIARGVLDYFPDALAAVANVSYVGNAQHNGNAPMHWAREKSTDHADCIVRHLIDRGKLDTDGLRHTAKVAWRGLALLQEELERELTELHQSDTIGETQGQSDVAVNYQSIPDVVAEVNGQTTA